jgi:prevent-host-death family protein
MRISTTKFQNAFGKFLKHAMKNKDVTITKNGKAVAKLVAYQDPEIPIVSESTADYFIHK